MQRDGVAESKVLERMNNQWDQSRKVELSDFHIVNDEKKLIIPQVLELHNLLLKYSI